MNKHQVQVLVRGKWESVFTTSTDKRARELMADLKEYKKRRVVEL